MRRVFGPLHWLVVIAIGALAIIPIFYMVSIALTPDQSVSLGQVVPGRFSLVNLVNVWNAIPLAHEMANSLIVSVSAGVLASVVGLGVAYPLSRLQFRGRTGLLASLVSLQSVPQVIILLPIFITVATIQSAVSVKLIGSYYMLIAVYLTFSVPLSSWLLYVYLASLPRDIEESASVDGCSVVQVVRYIVIPLMRPGLVVSFLFSMLLSWSDVLFASVLTTDSTRTVAVGLQAFLAGEAGAGVSFWGSLMMASLLNAAIIAVLFLVCQRFLVRGLTAGAVTGQ